MAKMDEMNHRKQADEKRLDVPRAILGKKKIELKHNCQLLVTSNAWCTLKPTLIEFWIHTKFSKIPWYSARFYKILQDPARFCKIPKYPPRFCKNWKYSSKIGYILKDSARFHKILQDGVGFCKMMHVFTWFCMIL